MPGQLFPIKIKFAGSPTKVIAIPETAVVYSPDGNYVYKVIDGHIAKKASVTLGERNQQNIIVTSGLAEGDIIVTAGQLKIPADGTEVILASKLLEKVKQQETLK
jgi:membrane fusion protein (multidrug efflux system)